MTLPCGQRPNREDPCGATWHAGERRAHVMTSTYEQTSLLFVFSLLFCSYPSVKTLQGLGMLNMSVVAVDARVQWFNGSVVQRRV